MCGVSAAVGASMEPARVPCESYPPWTAPPEASSWMRRRKLSSSDLPTSGSSRAASDPPRANCDGHPSLLLNLPMGQTTRRVRISMLLKSAGDPVSCLGHPPVSDSVEECSDFTRMAQ